MWAQSQMQMALASWARVPMARGQECPGQALPLKVYSLLPEDRRKPYRLGVMWPRPSLAELKTPHPGHRLSRVPSGAQPAGMWLQLELGQR